MLRAQPKKMKLRFFLIFFVPLSADVAQKKEENDALIFMRVFARLTYYCPNNGFIFSLFREKNYYSPPRVMDG